MKKLLKLSSLIILFVVFRQYYLKNDLQIKDRAEHAKTWIKQQYKNLDVEGILGKETRYGTLNHEYSKPDNTGQVQSEQVHSPVKKTYPEYETEKYRESSASINSTENYSQNQVDERKYAGNNRADYSAIHLSDEEWVKAVTKEYSPESWNMLMEYDRLPKTVSAPSSCGGIISSNKSTLVFHYLKGNSRMELLPAMATNVHEIAHALQSQRVFAYVVEKQLSLDWNMVKGYIKISPEQGWFLSFPEKLLFPSAYLVKEIPQNLRTFRFETYINGKTSTQRQGIFGLLDELHAYYLEAKFSFEMLEAYREAAGCEANGLFLWVQKSQSCLAAFYEFDFFIREYLLYMKSNYPSNYKILLEYQPFREACSEVLKQYAGLIESYQAMVLSEIQRLNKHDEGLLHIDDGKLWLRDDNRQSIRSTPLFSKSSETLTLVLNSRKYESLAEDFPSAVTSPTSFTQVAKGK